MTTPIGITNGISISYTASKINLDGSKPIINGAIISGFSAAGGCTFQISGVSTPCLSFQLSVVPASGLLSENSQKVYIEADTSAISAIPSTGNVQPGLQIIESQNKLKA